MKIEGTNCPLSFIDNDWLSSYSCCPSCVVLPYCVFLSLMSSHPIANDSLPVTYGLLAAAFVIDVNGQSDQFISSHTFRL